MLTKKEKESWFTKIRCGDLYCPMKGCTWTFFTSFELASHVLSDCKFGSYDGVVPCTHCHEQLTFEPLKYHWRKRHRDMVKVLAQLYDGNPTRCSNYHCQKQFSGGFEQCKEYTKHSINCRPLFMCKLCKNEYSTLQNLKIHKCSGTVKREARKSVSKNEKGVVRDLSKRPVLTDAQEKEHVARWQNELTKEAKLACPVPSCDKEFYIPNHFVGHLDKESKIDPIFRHFTTVKCMYCSVDVEWNVFNRHMQNNHREITNILNRLKNGEECTCPNYMCPTKPVFTYDTGQDYMKHAMNCRPLFHCLQCGTDSRYQKYISNHKCGKQPIKLKYRSKETSLNSLSSPTTASSPVDIKQSTSSPAQNRGDFQRKPHKKSIGYGNKRTLSKPKASATMRRIKDALGDIDIHVESNSEEDLTNKYLSFRSKKLNSQEVAVEKAKQPDAASKKKFVSVKKERLSTAIQQHLKTSSSSTTASRVAFTGSKTPLSKPQRRSSTKQALTRIETTPTEYSSEDGVAETSLTFDGFFTPVVFPSDEQAENYPELIPPQQEEPGHPSSSLQNTAVQGTQGKSDTIDVHCFGEKRSQQSVQVLTKEWLKDCQKGLWRCVYPKCEKIFAIPAEFHKHLLSYPAEDKLRKHIFTSTTVKMTCCFCQTPTTVQGFVRHAKKHEKYFQPVKKNKLICPFDKCCKEFENSSLYLQHACDCPLERKEREEEKEEERKKALYAKWISNFSSGVFLCANETCGKIFSVPQEMVIHLQTCTKDCINEFVREKQDIVCPWCNDVVHINTFHVHFIDVHKQIYDVLSEKSEKYTCPNFNCPFVGYSLDSYQKHSVVCPPCILCGDCKATFTLYREFTEHECLASDSIFLEKSLNMWHNQVRSGLLRCPNPSCSSCFFDFQDLITHVTLCAEKSKFCMSVLHQDKINCSFCGVEKNLGNIVGHCRKEHVDIMEVLESLKIPGNKIPCQNYKCKMQFIDGVKYFHHASICKPLYFCDACQNEFSGKKSYKDHVCVQAGDKRKKEDRQIANQLAEWYNDIKSGLFSCPNSKCKQTFKYYETLIPHLKTCKKQDKLSERVVRDDKFFCCFCKSEVTLSMYMKHMDLTHPQIVAKLKQLEYTHNVRCTRHGCRQFFNDRGKFVQHALCCNVDFELHEGQTPANKTQFEFSNWLEDIRKGQMYCPNKGCKQEFFIIENFISHLKSCKVSRRGVNNAFVASFQALPCLICKKEFSAKELANHFRLEHTVTFAQLRLVSQGICVHCPCEECKQAFVDGYAYLRHVAGGCLLHSNFTCHKCNQKFTSEDLLNTHMCPRKDASVVGHEQVLDKLSQNSWYQDVMKGNLRCPNKNCSGEFVLPRDFITHLRFCSEGNEVSVILKRNELPCCFCKEYVLMGKYCTHLKSCHQEKAKKVSRGTESRGKKRSDSNASSSSYQKNSSVDVNVDAPTIPSPVALNLPAVEADDTGIESNPLKEKRGRPRKDRTPRKYNPTKPSMGTDTNVISSTFENTSVKVAGKAANNASKLLQDSCSVLEIGTGDTSANNVSTIAIEDFSRENILVEDEVVSQDVTCDIDEETTNHHGDTQKFPNHPGDTEESPISHPDDTEESPTSHSGDTKELPTDDTIDLCITPGSSTTVISQQMSEGRSANLKTELQEVESVLGSLDADTKTKQRKLGKERKRKLADDKGVIELVSELLKKKRRKSRYSHRKSFSSSKSSGQWTVTSIPKRIKREEEIYGPMCISQPSIATSSATSVSSCKPETATSSSSCHKSSSAGDDHKNRETNRSSVATSLSDVTKELTTCQETESMRVADAISTTINQKEVDEDISPPTETTEPLDEISTSKMISEEQNLTVSMDNEYTEKEDEQTSNSVESSNETDHENACTELLSTQQSSSSPKRQGKVTTDSPHFNDRSPSNTIKNQQENKNNNQEINGKTCSSPSKIQPSQEIIESTKESMEDEEIGKEVSFVSKKIHHQLTKSEIKKTKGSEISGQEIIQKASANIDPTNDNSTALETDTKHDTVSSIEAQEIQFITQATEKNQNTNKKTLHTGGIEVIMDTNNDTSLTEAQSIEEEKTQTEMLPPDLQDKRSEIKKSQHSVTEIKGKMLRSRKKSRGEVPIDESTNGKSSVLQTEAVNKDINQNFKGKMVESSGTEMDGRSLESRKKTEMEPIDVNTEIDKTLSPSKDVHTTQNVKIKKDVVSHTENTGRNLRNRKQVELSTDSAGQGERTIDNKSNKRLQKQTQKTPERKSLRNRNSGEQTSIDRKVDEEEEKKKEVLNPGHIDNQKQQIGSKETYGSMTLRRRKIHKEPQADPVIVGKVREGAHAIQKMKSNSSTKEIQEKLGEITTKESKNIDEANSKISKVNRQFGGSVVVATSENKTAGSMDKSDQKYEKENTCNLSHEKEEIDKQIETESIADDPKSAKEVLTETTHSKIALRTSKRTRTSNSSSTPIKRIRQSSKTFENEQEISQILPCDELSQVTYDVVDSLDISDQTQQSVECSTIGAVVETSITVLTPKNNNELTPKENLTSKSVEESNKSSLIKTPEPQSNLQPNMPNQILNSGNKVEANKMEASLQLSNESSAVKDIGESTEQKEKPELHLLEDSSIEITESPGEQDEEIAYDKTSQKKSSINTDHIPKAGETFVVAESPTVLKEGNFFAGGIPGVEKINTLATDHAFDTGVRDGQQENATECEAILGAEETEKSNKIDDLSESKIIQVEKCSKDGKRKSLEDEKANMTASAKFNSTIDNDSKSRTDRRDHENIDHKQQVVESVEKKSVTEVSKKKPLSRRFKYALPGRSTKAGSSSTETSLAERKPNIKLRTPKPSFLSSDIDRNNPSADFTDHFQEEKNWSESTASDMQESEKTESPTSITSIDVMTKTTTGIGKQVPDIDSKELSLSQDTQQAHTETTSGTIKQVELLHSVSSLDLSDIDFCVEPSSSNMLGMSPENKGKEFEKSVDADDEDSDVEIISEIPADINKDDEVADDSISPKESCNSSDDQISKTAMKELFLMMPTISTAPFITDSSSAEYKSNLNSPAAQLTTSLFTNQGSGENKLLEDTKEVSCDHHMTTDTEDELLQFQEGQTIVNELQDLLSHVHDDEEMTSSDETIQEFSSSKNSICKQSNTKVYGNNIVPEDKNISSEELSSTEVLSITEPQRTPIKTQYKSECSRVNKVSKHEDKLAKEKNVNLTATATLETDGHSSPKKIKRYEYDKSISKLISTNQTQGDRNVTEHLTRDINTNIGIIKSDVTSTEAVVFIETMKEKMKVNEWVSNISNFIFLCPTCHEISLRLNTMVKHMKSCMKKREAKEYLNQKVNCPECPGFKDTIDRLIYHFRTKHLLLNWYLGEVEKGNWAVCQNYTCAKYMDQVSEIREHYKKCKYLWRCKYCEVEYSKESSVRKHNCRDEESAAESEHNSSDVDSEDCDADVDETETVMVQEINNENNTPIDKAHDIPKEKSPSPRRSSDRSNRSDHSDILHVKSPIKEDIKSKDKQPLVEHKNNQKIEATACTVTKSSKGHSSEDHIDYEEWAKETATLKFKCRVNGCIYSTMNGFRKHLTKSHKKYIADRLCSQRINCPVQTCSKDRQVNLKLEGFVNHLRVNHLTLWNNLKLFESGEPVNCPNYLCNQKLENIEGIIQHFVSCKFAWKCEHCDKVLVSEQGVKHHNCEERQRADKRPCSPTTVEKVVEELPPVKRSKRKSAAIALNIMSSMKIVENLKDEAVKNKKKKNDDESDEDFVQKESRDSDIESEEFEEDDDNDTDGSESEQSVISVSDDEGNTSITSRMKNNNMQFSDEDFFKRWLEEHKSDEVLFPMFLPKEDDLLILNESSYEEFLPHSKCSPYIEIEYRKRNSCTATTPITKLELFQPMKSLQGSCTLGFYCGGPVWGLAWCPTSKNADQFLAVTCNQSLVERHRVIDTSSETGMIQIWSFGKLNRDPIPKLAYGLCHNYGPIFDVKWCPESYREKKEEIENRIGLLAAACGDGKLRILCIPRPKENSDTVFGHLKPCSTLVPHKKDIFENNRTGFCLCLSWQPGLDRRRIAAGFADGTVCIWNILTKSSLLKTTQNEEQVILPIITIPAHACAVRSISWCPYNNDIIGTGSSDKTSKIFNINQPYNPIYVIKRGMNLDLEWPKKRLGFFVSEDDCFNIIPSSARYMILEYFIKMLTKDDPKRAIPTSRHTSAVWSCAYNNHLDMMATGDAMGELIVIKDLDSQGTKQPLIKKKTEPVYRIERIPVNVKTPNNDTAEGDSNAEGDNAAPSDRDDEAEFNALDHFHSKRESHLQSFFNYKYKILDSNNFEFSQFRKKNDPDMKRICNSSLKNIPDLSDLETRSIQKITWNENLGCQTWLASGTRFGLVRIHNFRAWCSK